MALLFIEHDKSPQVSDVMGLYELESELNQILAKHGKTFNVVDDFLSRLKCIKSFVCHEDRVQVVKADELAWKDVVELFCKQMIDCLMSANITVDVEEATQEDVDAVIDDMIRPALAQHAGNISITYLQKHVLGLKLLGACQGCPFSLATLTSHVSRILGMYFPVLLILHIQQDMFEIES